jgi:hypothetical protein
MQRLYVSPPELKSQFWEEARLGDDRTRYLGISFE